ncbi:MAG TPA: aminopeptidase P family protein [Anaeromyxobacteraceae bacterium]|nr:aminopeptidase P family protein [Anaeromyxobacteraceae bacterium]
MATDRAGTRQSALRIRLAEAGLDGLLVTHLPNVRYLTGFTGSAGVSLVLADDTMLVTDFRYATQAPAEVGGDARVEVVERDVWERVGQRLEGRARTPVVGFEADGVTVETARRLAAFDRAVDWRPVTGLVEGLRVAKDEGEVAAIRQAARLAADAFEAAVPAVRAGTTERSIAATLEAELRRRGSEWHPFPTIVASGPRSALPHARTAARVIAPGDLVLIDFGAQVDGYCADLTRTVVAGRADERQRVVYDLVREAQRRALDGLRPGLTGAEGDALARGVIMARGFGEAFGHSLGHGLGLEVHEAPRLSRANADPLPDGAVVTVEPGVYLPGWGGVRLEDDVHLTRGGAALLSDGCTALRELA